MNSRNEVAAEPFSLFEEYMIMDDAPQYPMDPVFQLCFSGTIDPKIARQALGEVIDRHPILRSLAVRRHGRFYWIPTEKRPEIVYVDYDTRPEILNASGFPSVRRLNLFEEPGLRICHIESKQNNWSRLVLQFHHSVADGLGIMSVLNEWLVLYARAVGAASSDVVLPEIDRDAFKTRRKIGWTIGTYFKNYFHTWRTTHQFVFGVPKPLVPTRPFDQIGLEADYPKVRTLRLTQDETRDYVRRAKSLGVTVNDALLADFFLAMDKWLTDVRHDEKNGRMRVMVPVNVRTALNKNAPLSNVVSTIFIDRSRRQIAMGKEALLKSLSSETKWAKKREQHVVFLIILWVMRHVPWMTKTILRLPISRATGVLSNLGRILEDSPLKRDENGRLSLGDITLENIEGKAPIRHKTSLSVVALTYAGELNLCVRYDSRLVSEDEAQEFLRIFRSFLF